jgi:hypothetical protein
VFYTLINPHSRKDLRVGTWHSRGKVTCNRFVMNKLYYTGDPNRTKEDGITLIEFVLRMDQQVGLQDPFVTVSSDKMLGRLFICNKS